MQWPPHGGKDMTTNSLNKEQRILIAMRKTLADVVKDTTPLPGRRHLLKESTIQNIRDCFSLISARERELAESAPRKVSRMRPRYADEPHDEKVVPIGSIKKSTTGNR